jgi:hypothetical protein
VDIESIEGTVLNGATQQPIARALVYTPDNQYATLTDDRGHFQLKFLPLDESEPPAGSPNQPDSGTPRQTGDRRNRPNTLMARRPEFLEDSMRMTVESVKDDQAQVVLMLEPEALIVGHVQFPGADGAERIGLQLYRQGFQEGREHWSLAGYFYTWASGEFRFSELPAGTYKLFTEEGLENTSAAFNERNQIFGYPPVFYPNATDFASGAPIRVASGAIVNVDIRVARKPYYPVSIAVADPPADGSVSVIAYSRNHPGPGYSLAYDPNKQAVRGMLPDGAYTLRIFQQGNGEAGSGTLNFVVRGGPAEGYTITSLANGNLTINLTREFETEGASGSASPGYRMVGSPGSANITLTSAETVAGQEPPFGMTGNNDKVTIEHITPGRYWLTASAYNCYVASALWDGRDVLRQPITVEGDNVSVPIEVTLRNDGAQVSGVVTSGRMSGGRGSAMNGGAKGNADQESVPQAFVYFIPLDDSGGEYRQIESMPDGSFQAMQLTPGRYRVAAFEKEHGELGRGNPEARKKYESKGMVVELEPRQTLQLPAPLRLESEP